MWRMTQPTPFLSRKIFLILLVYIQNGKLNPKTDEVYHDNRERYNQAREINFPEQCSILYKGEGRTGETFGEKCPQNDAGEIKQRRRQPISGQAHRFLEYQQIDHQNDDRLKNNPQRA